MKIRKPFKKTRAYTLIEALVAGVVLMIGVSAASQLSLTLMTQEEMNRRIATAMNYQENVAALFRLGFNEEEILTLIPPDPVIDSLTTSLATHDLGGGLGTIDYAEITIDFKPMPADAGWTGGLWDEDDPVETRTSTILVYLSDPPLELD